jgi:hypothetical protein
MKISHSATIPLTGSVQQLIGALSQIPPQATISVSTYEGDRPWDSSYSTLTASWTTEEK